MVSATTKLDPDSPYQPFGTSKFYMVKWSLLVEWWHAAPGTTEDEILDLFADRIYQLGTTRKQFAQRLYGGFICPNPEGGTHIYLDAGAFTYLGPSQRDYDQDERNTWWKNAIEDGITHQPDFIVKQDWTAAFATDCPQDVRDLLK